MMSTLNWTFGTRNLGAGAGDGDEDGAGDGDEDGAGAGDGDGDGGGPRQQNCTPMALKGCKRVLITRWNPDYYYCTNMIS